MPRLLALLSSRLRAATLLLVAVSVLVIPVLNSVGDLHEVEHIAATAAEHGHLHGDEALLDDLPSEHASGAHGLLHQADVGGSFFVTAALASLTAHGLTEPHPSHRTAADLQHPRAQLFKPPLSNRIS